MPTELSCDAVIVGSGPNGLAAAITLARTGRSVLVIEGADTIGGGARTAELTLPGFLHDTCSAIHPLAAASPFLRQLALHQQGLTWIHPPLALAHPLDDQPPVLLQRSLEQTALGLGADGPAYRRLLGPLVEHWEKLVPELLAPLHLPRRPVLLARFAARGLGSAAGVARRRFGDERTRALWLGVAGHSMLPLTQPLTAAIGLVLLAAAHTVGWPLARGGAGAITAAMAEHLRRLGGRIVTGQWVKSLQDLPPCRAVLLDLAPRQMAEICAGDLPADFRAKLQAFRHGPGVFKIDWALSAPIPWKHPLCGEAGTVHLAGSSAEALAGEAAVWRGDLPARPFVLLTQPSLFDGSRAPPGRHVAWAYCHVPHGCPTDMTEAIEAQVERFAPGFGDCVLARHTRTAVQMQEHNPSYIGGDITGGAMTLGQFIRRPTWRAYRTPNPRLFLCSASTPPGSGVHGLCGYYAARAALAGVLA